MTNTFIKAVEIWVPTPDRTRLTLKNGHYGELDYFERISRGMQLAYDEGLPGKCWAAGHPLMLKDLGNSYFQRGDAAMTVGLSSATAIPHFVDNVLTGVTVLFCGDNAHHVGAIELWHAPAGEPQMKLYDGYFGKAEKFEFASRHTQFSRKVGLPGIVWDTGLPLIMEDLGKAEQFLRRDDAAKVGIGRGIGFPVAARGDDAWMLVMLSAQNSPIAQGFALWKPDAPSGCWRFISGYSESGEDIGSAYGGKALPLDVGPMAEATVEARSVVAPLQTPGSLPDLVSGAASVLVLPAFVKGNIAAALTATLP